MPKLSHFAELLSDSALEGIDNAMDMDVGLGELAKGAGVHLSHDLHEILRIELERIAGLFGEGAEITLRFSTKPAFPETPVALHIYPTGDNSRSEFVRGGDFPEAIKAAEAYAATWTAGHRVMSAADLGFEVAA